MSAFRTLAMAAIALLILVQSGVVGLAQVVGSVWTSPTYGFSVSWTNSTWQADTGASLSDVGPEHLDRLHLINGISSLYIEGASRYQGDLPSCIAEEANILAEEPGVSNLQPYLDVDGRRMRAAGSDAEAAAFTLTLDAGGEQLDLINYVECQVLIPGEAVLVFTLVTEPEAFAQELALAREVIASVTPAEAIPVSPLEDYGGLVAAAKGEKRLAGPLAGRIGFGPKLLGVERTGVDAADFYARVSFAHAVPAELESWDVGVGFRDLGGERQYRLVVDAEGSWFLKYGLDPVIAQGSLVDFDTNPKGSNTIELVTKGDVGYFAFNERLVSELDLSAHREDGNFFVGAGFFTEDAIKRGAVEYSGLEVWSLADGSAEAGEAPSPQVLDATVFAKLTGQVTQQKPLAGPVAGELIQDVGAATVAAAGIEAENFLVSATLVNPSSATEQPWDFGIAFREQENGDHYRLSIASDGRWKLQVGTQPPLAGGTLPALNFAGGASNRLTLLANGKSGAFAVNGAFASELDLSALSGASDVWLGTGFNRAAVAAGAVTRYTDFTVWALPTNTPQGATPAAPAAPAATPVAGAGSPQKAGMRLTEVEASGVTAVATLSEQGAQVEISVTVRGEANGETPALYVGHCADLPVKPLEALPALDAAGKSRATLDFTIGDLMDGNHAIALHAAADDAVVACGDVPLAP